MPLRTPNKGKRKLHKLPDQAKLCGVCAGLAEYFGLETWVVRLLAITMLIFPFGFNGPVLIAYIVLCIVLDAKPGHEKHGKANRHYNKKNIDAEDLPYRPSVKEVWRREPSAAERLNAVADSLDKIDKKLQRLEKYVTSSKFRVAREFEKL